MHKHVQRIPKNIHTSAAAYPTYASTHTFTHDKTQEKNTTTTTQDYGNASGLISPSFRLSLSPMLVKICRISAALT